MNFNVPQYIEVEDKIAFQLTIKQLGWLALGSIGLFFLWQTGSTPALIVIGFPIVLLSLAFAFFKPAGMTFLQFTINGVLYLFKPKVLTWRRESKMQETRAPRKLTDKKQKASINRYMKEKALKSSDSLADILDKNSKI